MQPERRADILLVDDSPANLLALEAVLADLGHNLVKANSGAEALRYLLDHDVALILLDVQMPGMNGFETGQLIHQRERSRTTPIVYLTAYEQNDAEVYKGYSTGAVDFLIKPFIPAVLRSKVAVFVELFQKTEQIRAQAEMLREIERAEHQRQMAAAQAHWEQERLREGIRMARHIQQKLFPAKSLPSEVFEICGASHPAEETGGDYFDYIRMRDGDLAIVIGDVSGHGLGPALLMAALRAYVRALLLTQADPSEVFFLLNNALIEDSLDGHFATLLLARINSATGSIAYASAGHVPGFVLSASGDVKCVLESTALPLAIDPNVVFPGVAVPALEPGDLMLLVTDGIVEAHGSEGELFGTDQLLAVARHHRQLTARQLLDRLFASLEAHCGTLSPSDDMTAIVIKALPAAEATSSSDCLIVDTAVAIDGVALAVP
jgi:serine phosphatase RsbU (regulator of sigma subunit)